MIINWTESDLVEGSVSKEVLCQQLTINCNGENLNLGGGEIVLRDEVGGIVLDRFVSNGEVVYSECRYSGPFSVSLNMSGLATISICLEGIQEPAAISVDMIVSAYSEAAIADLYTQANTVIDQAQALIDSSQVILNNI